MKKLISKLGQIILIPFAFIFVAFVFGLECIFQRKKFKIETTTYICPLCLKTEERTLVKKDMYAKFEICCDCR